MAREKYSINFPQRLFLSLLILSPPTSEMSINIHYPFLISSFQPPDCFRDYLNNFDAVQSELQSKFPKHIIPRPMIDIGCFKIMLYQCFNRGFFFLRCQDAISDHELLVNFLILQLTSNLERRQKKLVTQLLSVLNKDGCLDHHLPSFGLPSSHNEWRRCFVDGNNSLRRYIPSVKAIELKNHAVVDPRFVLREILSSNIVTRFTPNNQHHNMSTPYQKIDDISKQSKCLVIPIYLFSDGFNTSHTGGLRDRTSSWSMFICLFLVTPTVFVSSIPLLLDQQMLITTKYSNTFFLILANT